MKPLATSAMRSSLVSCGFVLSLALLLALGGALPAAAGPPAQKAHAAAAQTRCPPLAQPLSPEQLEAGMRDARDRGFLWRISKDGRTSYLYGTIHVGRVAWMFPGPVLTDALRASDVVALELDLSDS